MKSILIGAVALLLVGACSAPSVVWTEGLADESGKACHTLELRNVPGGSRVWFARIPQPFTMEEGAPAAIQWYMGNIHYVDVPESGTLVLRYVANPLARHSWAPEGFVLQRPGHKDRSLQVDCHFQERKGTAVDPSWFAHDAALEPADLIPAVKSVTYGEGRVARPDEAEAVRVAEDHPAGWYRLTVGVDGARIEAADEDGAFYGTVTLRKLPDEVPPLTIEDWPDLPYRGFMLDVARSFTTKEHVKVLLDLLASYKVNTFHFHLVDDEGWRLEIPELPDLTQYASVHALPVFRDGKWQETDALLPSTDGSIGATGPAAGYYTEEDYKDILRYAWARRIRVIPEIDTPGHSRAAIKAMEAYERRTGDGSFRLSSPDDTSHYRSAQAFTDDVLDVTLPGVYKFMDTMFAHLVRLHAEAGVPLEAIHIGGDEVARGAWAGRDRTEMKDRFIRGMMDLARKYEVKLAGWQEITMGIRPETVPELIPLLYSVNAWNTRPGSEEVPYNLANAGYPILLSNVANTYVDLAYDDAPEEIGLDWGGLLDERKSFALQPYKVYESIRWTGVDTPVDLAAAALGKKPLEQPENIIGVQAQLWAEQIRCFDHVTYDTFPKALGVFERGWNARPDWPDDAAFAADFNRFYTIIHDREMPRWDQLGLTYKQRP